MKNASLALLLLTSLSNSYAKEQKIQHDAHEHGVAEMNIVWEKETLNIELLSPAYNISGFEYQPANHEQEELIEKIEKRLNLPNELFEFEGASCKAISTKIESPFEDHDDHEKHEAKAKDDHEEQKHAKHEEHGTKDKHDDDHNDEHKDHESQEKHADHDEHAEDDKSSTHSEYSISYEFSCTNSKAVLSVNASNLFKHFPQLEKVKVQWLSSTQQSSSVLSKKNNTVTLN